MAFPRNFLAAGIMLAYFSPMVNVLSRRVLPKTMPDLGALFSALSAIPTVIGKYETRCTEE